jgi:hypothetical protein
LQIDTFTVSFSNEFTSKERNTRLCERICISVSEKEETNKSSLSLSIFKANKDFPATMPLASDKHTGSSQIPSSNFIPALFFYGFSILASSMILSLVLSIFIMLGVESSDNVKAKI